MLFRSESGGGSHTYIFTPKSATLAIPGSIYITAVMPVTLPQRVQQQMKKDVTFVDHAVGPEVCRYSRKIQRVKGKYSELNGTTVTVKVNGKNPEIGMLCSDLKKGGFNPTSF